MNNSFQSEIKGHYEEPFFNVFFGLTLLAVGEAVLQIEWEVCKDFAAVGAAEALRMEVGAESLQTILKQKCF